MTKTDILAKLEEYKDRPVEIGINGAGDITVYGNIEGHWLFINSDTIVAVAKNITNAYGIASLSQKEKPFHITSFGFEQVTYIKAYMSYDSIATDVAGMTPAASSKSLDDVIKELQSDSINKANDPRTFNNDSVYGSESFGRFKGSAISTNINGLPDYIKDMK